MDPNQIRFRTGERMTFTATRNFALGNTGATIPKGAEVLFDGSTVEFAGMTYSFPQLRGAIRLDWVVMAANYDETDPSYGRPERANIQVRHATKGGNPMQPQPKMAIQTTESDEREVGNVTQHARATRETNRNYVRGQTPVNPVNVVQAGETVRGQNGFEVVEQQDGVEIPGRSFKTMAGEKAKNTATTLTAESAALALSKASNVTIEPGRGVTQDEMLERMTPEAQEEYLNRKAALRAQYVVDEPAPTRTVVSQLRKAPTQHTEGMIITPNIGGGVEIADPVGDGIAGKPRQSVIVEDGITFRTTNGPDRHMQESPNRQPASAAMAAARAAVPEAPPEVRKMIAKAVCADFPDNYDFAVPLKKRVARLQADYENRPDVIKAVFAAEGDEMKSILMQEFPQAFAG